MDAHKAGVKLFGDVGWDPSGEWSSTRLDNLQYFHAFMPNQREAMAFTGKDNPWAALYCPGGPGAGGRGDARRAGRHGCGLGDGRGGVGAVAAGVRLRSRPGPGDCFGAAFIVGCLAGWPLGDRLRFANLCAALAVQEVGGSLAAPGWGDIADWWQRANARQERQSSQWLRRYSFLEDIVRDVPPAGAAPGARRPSRTSPTPEAPGRAGRHVPRAPWHVLGGDLPACKPPPLESLR